ncbi:MAG: hypothetical protein ACO1O4_16635 [Devosia sp.]
MVADGPDIYADATAVEIFDNVGIGIVRECQIAQRRCACVDKLVPLAASTRGARLTRPRMPEGGTKQKVPGIPSSFTPDCVSEDFYGNRDQTLQGFALKQAQAGIVPPGPLFPPIKRYHPASAPP